MQQPPTSTSFDNDNPGTLTLPWMAYFTSLTSWLSGLPSSKQALPNYLNDAAAAAGGVALYGYYRNGSIVMQRIV